MTSPGIVAASDNVPPILNAGSDLPITGTLDGGASGSYWGGNPANLSGTITTISYKRNSGIGGTVAFFTYDPATNEVRTISATVTAVVGLNDYTVSLTVVAGDLIGCWANQANSAPCYQSQSGDNRYFVTGAKPAARAVLTPSSTIADSTPCVRGV